MAAQHQPQSHREAQRVLTVLRTTARALSALDAAQTRDTNITVRVVGPFSAGKTRLVAELLKVVPGLPERLLPLSSPGVETRFPLEVTFGTEPRLSYRDATPNEDGTPKPPQELRSFLDARTLPSVPEAELEHHRLRLEIPIEGLLYKTNGNRIHLLDTPGWDAPTAAAQPMPVLPIPEDGQHLALIFVLPYDRLEHVGYREDFRRCISCLYAGDFPDDFPLLIVVITQCGAALSLGLDNVHLQELEPIRTIWKKQMPGGRVHIALADFGRMSHRQEVEFRHQVWHWLEIARAANKERLVFQVERRVTQEAAFSMVLSASRALAATRHVLGVLFEGGSLLRSIKKNAMDTYPPPRFLPVLQQKVLMRLRLHDLSPAFSGLSLDEALALLQTWASLPGLQVYGEDPLAGIKGLWLEQLQTICAPFRQFLSDLGNLLKAMNAATPDYGRHLAPLERPAAQALRAIKLSTFVYVVAAAETIPKADTVQKVLATLLQLTLVEAAFRDGQRDHKAVQESGKMRRQT